MALDAEKFDRWQPNLLALLNEPKLKRFIRWRMGLNRRVGRDEEIIAIDPHHFTVPLRGGQFRSSFSSQPALQKALYRGFKPVFWGMHAYDWLLPDRVSQRWVQSLIRPMRPAFEGFGLSTLTAYPQAGGGGSNVTCDGYVEMTSVDETFSALCSDVGNKAQVTDGYIPIELDGSSTTNQFSDLKRVVFTFDTSSLTSAAVISGATFYVRTWGPNSSGFGGTWQGCLVSASPASMNNLQTSDYTCLGSSLWSSGNPFSTSSLSLNSTGLAGIKQTGVTGLGIRLWWDFNNDFDGTWAASPTMALTYFYAADVGSNYSAYWPSLTVTYSMNYSQALTSALATMAGSANRLDQKGLAGSTATMAAQVKCPTKVPLGSGIGDWNQKVIA